MADRVGQQLGNYQLVRLLGEGGFAEVYLGEHIHLGTQAAIKVLHTQLASDDSDKFRTEARTVARLIHPNIVRVLEFGIEGKTPYLVMDYAPNGTLRQFHPRGKPLPLATIVPYVKQIADALQYAHEEKLVHRDIKPENMLLGRRNEVLLSDFGIALVAQSSRYQSTQDMAGTMAYMAPEQIQGKPRPASDQYSLGIVVYEWLTGERPFHGSFTEIVAQHLAVPPPPLREKLPDVSPDVEQVVMLALSKDPHGRFQSIQAFANAMQQVNQSSAPTILKPLPPVQTSQVVVPSEPPVKLVNNPILPPTVIVTPAHPLGSITCTYRGHRVNVVAASWSPGGKYIASGDGNGSVHVWDAMTGARSLTYSGHKQWVSAVAWSPDGGRIASGSQDGTVQIWHAVTGSHLFTYRGHARAVSAVAWSPDGTRIVSGSEDSRVQVWNAASGGSIFTYSHDLTVHTVAVNAVGWSPTGAHIASAGGDKSVRVWEAGIWRNAGIYRGHADIVLALAWSRDGTHIVSGGYDQAIQVWDVASGRTLLTYRGHSRLVRTLSWSPGGGHIASGGNDMTAQVWDASSGRKTFMYGHHSGAVKFASWSPDGKYIASGGDDRTVRVWAAS